jgi:uncharacterized iron-regulated protein
VKEAYDAHGHLAHTDFERFYAAQLLWDETMATRVAEVMAPPEAPHRLMVVAGEGHVRHFAVPDRAQRRGAAPYLIILPLMEADLAEAKKQQLADVLWVLKRP